LKNTLTDDTQQEDIEVKLPEGPGRFTLLHYACSCGDKEIFEFVYNLCTDLENFLFAQNTNEEKEVPLHWAVQRGQLEITKVLVERMQ
jgi:ankyrin repeat protein